MYAVDACAEQVVTHEKCVAAASSQCPPCVPVLFGQRILERRDRVVVEPAAGTLDHIDRLTVELVHAVPHELRGGDVDRERDVVAGTSAGALDALDGGVEHLFRVCEWWRKPALVGA